MKNTFYVSCPIDTYSGYGARSRDFVKALISLNKYEVKVLPQRWGNTPFGFIDNNPEWEFMRSYVLWNTPMGQVPEQPDIWCQITVPNEFQPIGKYNIGVTAGIETTLCDATWIEGMNRMNLNLVSSNHSKQVFDISKYFKDDQRTGKRIGEVVINKSPEVLFEGANLDIYKPIKEFKNKTLYKDLNSIPENFAFLVVGHWMQGEMGEDRKNIGLTLKSFYEVFKNKKKQPALILKSSLVGSSYIDRRELMKRINDIRSTCGGNLPNIYLLHGEFTDPEMNELYNHPKVKAMVIHTKGEGFGRPLLEFSLSNKPIIASGWSGHTDFLNPEFTGLLAGKLTNVHKSAAQKGIILENSQWFSADHNAIGSFYLDFFKNYKDWKVRGKRQGYRSRTDFSFEKMANLLGEILESNIKPIPKNVSLNLPKLKKAESKPELPTLQLPTLKKV